MNETELLKIKIQALKLYNFCCVSWLDRNDRISDWKEGLRKPESSTERLKIWEKVKDRQSDKSENMSDRRSRRKEKTDWGRVNTHRYMCVLVIWLCQTLFDPMEPTRLLCPRDSPGKNTGVRCLSLLQGIFPTQDWTQVSGIASGFFTSWATREAHSWIIFHNWSEMLAHKLKTHAESQAS